MRSKITSVALAFLLSVSVAGISYAARCKGTVTSAEGNQLVIKVSKKCKIKAGDKVKIKAKKAAAVEGC